MELTKAQEEEDNTCGTLSSALWWERAQEDRVVFWIHAAHPASRISFVYDLVFGLTVYCLNNSRRAERALGVSLTPLMPSAVCFAFLQINLRAATWACALASAVCGAIVCAWSWLCPCSLFRSSACEFMIWRHSDRIILFWVAICKFIPSSYISM